MLGSGAVEAFYVHWRAGEENKPAVIGGFLRCDTQQEVDDFVGQCEARGARTHVTTERRY